jgi:hypothetical protein
MFDVQKAIQLKQQGNSYKEISKILGCSPQNIHQKIKDLIPKSDTEKYIAERADILAKKNQKVLEYLDDEKLKKSTAMQIASIYGILYDKERIERGLSDNNARPLVMIQINQDGKKPVVEGDIIDVKKD